MAVQYMNMQNSDNELENRVYQNGCTVLQVVPRNLSWTPEMLITDIFLIAYKGAAYLCKPCQTQRSRFSSQVENLVLLEEECSGEHSCSVV